MNKFQQLNDWMGEEVAERKISGCCAAVYQNGENVFRNFCGYANLERGVPVSENTLFRLASMTKPITAVAALLCMEEGLLRPDTPVCEPLPEFSHMYLACTENGGLTRGSAAENKILLRHLLTHSSGLGSGASGDLQYDSLKPREGDILASAVPRYAACLLEFVPGTAQAYSPVFGFDVVARMVELASGLPYADFLRKKIFQPLGMHSATYELGERQRADCAVTYRSEGGKLSAEPLEHNFDTFPAGYTGGGAGLLCTLADYCRFACELLDAYYGEGRVFSERLVREMSVARFSTDVAGIFDFFNWGYGVRVVQAINDIQVLTPGSFGWSGAYGTHFWVDPVRRAVAVYMHNSSTYGGAGAPHTQAFERAVMQGLA